MFWKKNTIVFGTENILYWKIILTSRISIFKLFFLHRIQNSLSHRKYIRIQGQTHAVSGQRFWCLHCNDRRWSKLPIPVKYPQPCLRLVLGRETLAECYDNMLISRTVPHQINFIQTPNWHNSNPCSKQQWLFRPVQEHALWLCTCNGHEGQQSTPVKLRVRSIWPVCQNNQGRILYSFCRSDFWNV